MRYTLRSYFRSSCSWRVRISLAHKGLSYETIPVHLLQDGGQQHGQAHRAANPMRELPVLLIGDEPLAQSMAILEYLEDAHPSPALLPEGHLARARVRQMAEVINSGIQPIQNLRVMQKLQKILTWKKRMPCAGRPTDSIWLRRHSRNSAVVIVTEMLNIADALILNYLMSPILSEFKPYPSNRVESALNELEAFKVSHPSARMLPDFIWCRCLEDKLRNQDALGSSHCCLLHPFAKIHQSRSGMSRLIVRQPGIMPPGSASI